MKIDVRRNILEANQELSRQNREFFKKNKVLVVNIMAAPGAGKTSTILKTIDRLQEKINFIVVEGDIASSIDTEKIEKRGIPAVQINTGNMCHLDANMIREVMSDLPLKDLDLLIIENVGNLVCPAEFKIGEDIKIMVLSIAEGHDKPLKYPLMFQESSALLLNKIDLLPYTNADTGKMKKDSLSLNPKLKIFEVSCKTGEGISDWTKWLQSQIK